MNAVRSIRNVTTLSLVFFATVTVKADLPLGEIPADAHIIITVNSIAKTETAAKAFAKRCGIPVPPKLSIQQLLESVGAPGIAETKRGMASRGNDSRAKRHGRLCADKRSEERACQTQSSARWELPPLFRWGQACVRQCQTELASHGF